MHKISIITINYNNAEGLEKTIESVVNQTLVEFEFIVIDGGSNDESAEVIKKNEGNIHYWISENDLGIYNAMNKGIKKAQGEYLLFLNSGDHFYNNDVIQKSIQHLENKDIIYFDVKIIGVGCHNSKIVSYPDLIRFSDFYTGGICHQSVFIKKTLFEKIGLYDENLKIAADWKFFILALFKYNCTYKKVEEILSTYYLGGISSQVDNIDERETVLKEYFEGYVEDYKEFLAYRNCLKSNRFRMLVEIEKSTIGSKLASFFFRTYIFLFAKSKLKEFLE